MPCKSWGLGQSPDEDRDARVILALANGQYDKTPISMLNPNFSKLMLYSRSPFRRSQKSYDDCGNNMTHKHEQRAFFDINLEIGYDESPALHK
jgi:hypothetical protein